MHDLNTRLKTAAGFVRHGSVAADIGTDHAYLPAYLILNNIVSKVIACDLRSGPLENAAETVREFKLENNIELRLSDGLDMISPDEADDIIICGMGGNLITDILSRAFWLKDSKYRLILQPQSHAYDLRNYLYSNNYRIINETGVRSEGRVYTIIAAEYNADFEPDYNDIDVYFGSLIYNSDDVSSEICRRTLGYLKVRYESELKFGDNNESERFRILIEKAEEIINEN